MTGSPGLSRWNAGRVRNILPGTPDPAEAGTPERRYRDYFFNVHSPGRQSISINVMRRFTAFSVTALVKVEEEVKREKNRARKTKPKRNEAVGSGMIARGAVPAAGVTQEELPQWRTFSASFSAQ
jgi:hypothetical protein